MYTTENGQRIAKMTASVISDMDSVLIVVRRNGKRNENLRYQFPGMLSGADLAEVLTALNVEHTYIWNEGEEESE